jgi:hypothetical protein
LVNVFNFVIIQYFCCMSVDFLIPVLLCLCHCFSLHHVPNKMN